MKAIDFDPIILSEQTSGARTIIEKFEAKSKVGFAVVLLTPDDEGCKRGSEDHEPRARQNVVFELGYFVGRRSRDRVCDLKRGDVEIPSDLHGIAYIPFDEENGWKLTLARELEDAGFEVDSKKVMRA